MPLSFRNMTMNSGQKGSFLLKYNSFYLSLPKKHEISFHELTSLDFIVSLDNCDYTSAFKKYGLNNSICEDLEVSDYENHGYIIMQMFPLLNKIKKTSCYDKKYKISINKIKLKLSLESKKKGLLTYKNALLDLDRKCATYIKNKCIYYVDLKTNNPIFITKIKREYKKMTNNIKLIDSLIVNDKQLFWNILKTNGFSKLNKGNNKTNSDTIEYLQLKYAF